MAVPGIFWLGDRRDGRGPGMVLKRGARNRQQWQTLLSKSLAKESAETKNKPLRFRTRPVCFTVPFGDDSLPSDDVALCLLKLHARRHYLRR